jgi:hypothetical protein
MYLVFEKVEEVLLAAVLMPFASSTMGRIFTSGILYLLFILEDVTNANVLLDDNMSVL